MCSNELYHQFLSKVFSRSAELLNDNSWRGYGLNNFGREFEVVSMDECRDQGSPK